MEFSLTLWKKNIIPDGIWMKFSKLLDMTVEDIDPNQNVSGIGVGSLVTVEFQTWLGKAIGVDVPLLDMLNAVRIEPIGMGAKLASVSELVSADLKTEGISKK